jgi:hypothetical protein
MKNYGFAFCSDAFKVMFLAFISLRTWELSPTSLTLLYLGRRTPGDNRSALCTNRKHVK